MRIKLERIYTKPADLTGYRILVDRLWPRGISKANAKLDKWFKEIGPSKELRKWFNHEDEKYQEFRKKYLRELAQSSVTIEFSTLVKEQLKKQDVIFLFSTKNEEHNQAVVLKEYIEKN